MLPLLMDPKADEIVRRTSATASKRNEYFVIIVANIVGISWGTSVGWSSPVIAKMMNNDSPLDYIPTSEQFSWIGSILPVGGLLGAIICSPLPNRIGRKNCLLIGAIFFIVSFVVLMFTKDLKSIYVARLLQGIGSGLVMVVLPIYIGEISSPERRGILSNFMLIEPVMGVLYAYSIGPFVSYVMFQIFCLLTPVAFLVLLIFIPDTPHYHFLKNDRIKATKVLQYLRGCNCDISSELNEIEKDVMESKNVSNGLLNVFKGLANLNALFIGVGLIFFQVVSGIDAVLFYSEIILMKASSSIDSAVATIIIGSVLLLSSLISPFFVDRTGRRGLLIISAAGMALSCIVLGTYFFLNEKGSVGDLGWLPVTSLVCFIVSFSVGFGYLSFTILGELFSTETKSIFTSIAISVFWSVDFIVTKNFLPLENVIGNYGNFWLFGGFSIFAFMFSWLFVFETKGLSLSEIQNRLNRRKKSDVRRDDKKMFDP